MNLSKFKYQICGQLCIVSKCFCTVITVPIFSSLIKFIIVTENAFMLHSIRVPENHRKVLNFSC